MRQFVNRGFLNGPMLPIYGSGALIVVFMFGQGDIAYPRYALFLLGGLMACFVEYITSWAMEKLFHERWWDYSKKPFNLNGRICLEGFVCFGLFSVVAIQYIQPFFNMQLSKIPYRIQLIISVVLIVIFVIDLIQSVHIANDLKTEIEDIRKILEIEQEKLHLRIQDKQKELAELQNITTLKEFMELIEVKLKENEKYRYGHRRILKAFPYLVKHRMRDIHEKIHRD